MIPEEYDNEDNSRHTIVSYVSDHPHSSDVIPENLCIILKYVLYLFFILEYTSDTF